MVESKKPPPKLKPFAATEEEAEGPPPDKRGWNKRFIRDRQRLLDLKHIVYRQLGLNLVGPEARRHYACFEHVCFSLAYEGGHNMTLHRLVSDTKHKVERNDDGFRAWEHVEYED